MNKIVITGALGHIGSHLLRALPVHWPDMDIVLIDNLVSKRYSSLFNLPEKGRYHFVEADVTTANLDHLYEGARAVVHLAAITDATASFENKELVEKNNFEATQCVANACLKANTPLIHLSSTSVYGTQADRVDENCSPEELKPQSPYAETKLAEEEFVFNLTQQGLRAVSFRFGTIFGPSMGMRFHTAVNKFCWQAVMGHPLTVWRTAYDQRRPYLDLIDAVNAIVFFIEQDLFDGRIYNIVTQNASVREVVDHIKTHIPDLDVEFVDARIMNQLSYDVINTRLLDTGFSLSGDMGKGIADTIALFKRANNR